MALKESTLEVNYIIEGVLSLIPTEIICEKSHKSEIQRIYFVIKGERLNIISEASGDTESSIVKLQKALPQNVRIACCQSCKNGNFCPYGDSDNEIFCLKDIKINNKEDVTEFFSISHDLIITRSRKLIEFCSDYEPICHTKYYTYNDWDYK